MYQSNHERYQFAEQLYCLTDRSILEIADLTGISKSALYERARLYNWQTLRRASKRSPAIITEEMYRELSDLTANINSRPPGQRIPTPQEAELRRKILSSIAAVKKFPTHAEVAYIMQSLTKYIQFSTAHAEEFSKLITSFLSHRDFYGYASYQPEFEQDLNMADDKEMDLMYNSPDSPFNREDPDDASHTLDRNVSSKPDIKYTNGPESKPTNDLSDQA